MPITLIRPNDTSIGTYRDKILSLLDSIDEETLNNLKFLLDNRVSGIDKFEVFLKIISDNNVKCLYECRDELQVIIEKHILFNS
jgi:hypothetical protein